MNHIDSKSLSHSIFAHLNFTPYENHINTIHLLFIFFCIYEIWFSFLRITYSNSMTLWHYNRMKILIIILKIHTLALEKFQFDFFNECAHTAANVVNIYRIKIPWLKSTKKSCAFLFYAQHHISLIITFHSQQGIFLSV